MGRKRGGGRQMRNDDDDDDDVSSMASMETSRTIASEDAEFYDSYVTNEGDEEQIDEAVEQLIERRTTTRVAALAKLHKFLLGYLPTENISESFVDNVLACLRKPAEDEALLCANILAILGLIYGADNERFYQRSKNALEPLAKAASSQKVKTTALRSIAMVAFVCSVEEENSEEFFQIVEKYFSLDVKGPICASALEAWGLVASTLPDEDIAYDAFVDRFLPHFLILLDHSDVGVRSAAGENIALLFESSQKCGISLPCDAEIIDKFFAMSKDSSKKNSKKDRKVQRSVFRDIHATVASGESPHISFTVKSEQLEISSWKSVLQFEAIKKCLHVGLQEHIKYNNALRFLLDLPETLEDRANDRRDVFDKKSSSRKQRSNELKGDRKRKQHLQDSFFDEY